ncbi:MAG: hypothetical protein ABSF69_06050 [Polyangiaceae bacterium]|jgi:hypothetical protein
MFDPRVLDDALATVRRTLDRLTERGQNDAAFAIARAQFAASIRASWPANVSALARAIDDALANSSLALPAEEEAELRRAAAVLRGVPHG